jgi:hypothetical protein
MILVNESREVPVYEYNPSQCTRYCHNVGCIHTSQKYQQDSSPSVGKAIEAYRDVINWLGHNGSGLSYKEMNLALFVGFFPVGISLLLWGIIRKRS